MESGLFFFLSFFLSFFLYGLNRGAVNSDMGISPVPLGSLILITLAADFVSSFFSFFTFLSCIFLFLFYLSLHACTQASYLGTSSYASSSSSISPCCVLQPFLFHLYNLGIFFFVNCALGPFSFQIFFFFCGWVAAMFSDILVVDVVVFAVFLSLALALALALSLSFSHTLGISLLPLPYCCVVVLNRVLFFVFVFVFFGI
ncbi:hypothetical protein DFH27DRAFT_535160 [Peziza echinospora]|nr:hypothetical protein DFH27DRAFT_535160 [Peziza echinospora]